MKVFVTGAGGYIGSVLTKDLVRHGHKVVGLGRSEKSAQAIKEAGGQFVQGSVEDVDLLKRYAKESDGVIHLALSIDDFDFSRALKTDQDAIRARKLLISSTPG